MKRNDPTVILTGFAHALTWAVAVFMVFGTAYQGASVTAVTPGGASESTRTVTTLMGVNGMGVLPLLLAPMVVTGLALLAVLLINAGQSP